MKKTYIIPANKVVTINAAEMLAESNVDGLSTTLSEEVVTSDDYVKEFSSSSLWDSKW